jgi:selenocysteine lyase/cysteine desulfurase
MILNPDNEVDAIVAAITPRTRLVYVSHVSTRTGRRIDLAPIAAAAHRVWCPNHGRRYAFVGSCGG